MSGKCRAKQTESSFSEAAHESPKMKGDYTREFLFFSSEWQYQEQGLGQPRPSSPLSASPAEQSGGAGVAHVLLPVLRGLGATCGKGAFSKHYGAGLELSLASPAAMTREALNKHPPASKEGTERSHSRSRGPGQPKQKGRRWTPKVVDAGWADAVRQMLLTRVRGAREPQLFSPNSIPVKPCAQGTTSFIHGHLPTYQGHRENWNMAAL